MRNIGLKILSFLIALSIWIWVASEKRVQTNIMISSIPVGTMNIPDDVEILKISPTTVNLKLKGPSSIIKNLSPSDTAILIDISKDVPEFDKFKEEKTFNVKIKKKNVQVPKGIKVETVLPPTIQITLERKVVKEIKIILKHKLIPKEGFIIKKVDYYPKKIQVEGPISILKRRKFLVAEFQKTNIDKNIKETILLNVFDSRVIFRQTKITVMVEVEKEQKKRQTKKRQR